MHLTGRIELGTGLFTSAGPKPQNEDCLGVHIPDAALLPTKGIVACIADGVSAASAGKEAAESAVIGFISDYYETPESWEVKTAGQRVLTALNRWLFSQGQGFRDAEKGCVTTFTAVILKSQTAHVFHIGDSRLYRFRGGELEQITRDHASQVSADTCYLTRALGLTASPRIDYHTFPLETGDRYLLTTDGIHGELSRQDMEALIRQNTDSQNCADMLGSAAGAGQDNRSCILLEVKSLPDGNKDDVFRQLSSLPIPPDLLPGQSIDGLHVERLISASKNSQLYLVSDLDDSNRSYVLKTPSVSFEDDPAYLERFALEEWIGLRTDSPHLAKVIRRARPRRFLYYVMESIDGMTLERWSEKNPAPPVEQVVEMVGQIVEGVRALHRRDTLHQDLKPDNILLDASGIIKIIDYGSCQVGGIAEIATPFKRETSLGTLDFSAPEYRLGITATTRSDLFSIAVIFYHLLTGGHHPYGKAWARASSQRDFYNLAYQPAAAHNPMVPLWMDSVLRKALSIRSEDRHEVMSEFIHNLRHPDPAFLTAEPLPFAQRNPLLFWKLVAFIAIAGWIVTWAVLA
ncbi:bifunctional protein-serine/threonine kinase/phosphatase [Luteolibacter yonseiensis]|uniref:non-specific serine/threonine protein kinase n=1 Tax=Luteolibacter yonseiensis TaxID=1144680 RepID=A0A934R5A2_9BACT|nr:bifunctional protein-serine/threonine kinase/phosphatase [Luteolibacter yonseiensis]MBK1817227.1 bifunctional protein-serine/threonine kinase/phosphatase [Luteolibacter yonseiensis]